MFKIKQMLNTKNYEKFCNNYNNLKKIYRNMENEDHKEILEKLLLQMKSDYIEKDVFNSICNFLEKTEMKTFNFSKKSSFFDKPLTLGFGFNVMPNEKKITYFCVYKYKNGQYIYVSANKKQNYVDKSIYVTFFHTGDTIKIFKKVTKENLHELIDPLFLMEKKRKLYATWTIQKYIRTWFEKPYYSNGKPGFHARKGYENILNEKAILRV